MLFQKRNIGIILINVFYLISTVRGQELTCNLPNGQKSKCVRLHLCSTFQNLIKQYGGRPPQNVAQDIKNHICTTQQGTICCPDFASASTPPPPQNLQIQPSNFNYEAFKNHQNINLINDRKCGISTTNKIVNGVDANVVEIPWIALLGYETLDGISWGCGGTLISSRYVLTASHCNTRKLKIVRLGEHTISKAPDCDDFDYCADDVQDIPIEKFIKHPQFDASTKKNDIALIRLSVAADTSRNNIETICIPITNENDIEVISANPVAKNFLTIAGFGRLGNGVQSDVLQKAFVPFVTNEDCVQRYKQSPEVRSNTIHKEYLCAGGLNKTDTCQGDSGGPIYTVGRGRGRINLYGVVLGGIACDNPNIIFPGIYTDIRYYLNWILDNMKI